MKHSETARRLTLALSNARMKPQELADRSGVSKASISQYVNGVHVPSNISAGKMAAVLDVNPAWLMGLDAEMKKGKYIDITVNLSDQENYLLEFYRSLDDYNKGRMDQFVETLVEKKERVENSEVKNHVG